MLLNEFHGSATAVTAAERDDVFATITDIGRLPEWNARVESLIEGPETPLRPDVEWKVQMAVPPGARWVSRSRVINVDAERGRFEYMSQSDDGNPSFVTWSWTVTAEPAGTRVTVEWDVHPRTFWRRLLFARLRRRQLAREVPASLDALAYHSTNSETAT